MTDTARLITLRRYWSAHEAQMARNALRTRDVKAYLENLQTSSLGYPGNAVVVRLQVVEQDVALADSILSEFETDRADADLADVLEGCCPHCEAESEPGFDTCWRCGRTYEKPVVRRQRGEADNGSNESRSTAGSAPRATDQDFETARALIRRASGGALLGLWFLPLGFLIALWSLVLLMQVRRMELPLPRELRRHMAWAAWANGAIALLYSLIFGLLLWRWAG